MNDILEQRRVVESTATPPSLLASFQAGLTALRSRYPGRWLVYTDHWDEAAEEVSFEVFGDFDTEADAIRWTFSQTDAERTTLTVFSTRVPERGQYRVA